MTGPIPCNAASRTSTRPIYVSMQGPSELGISPDAKLANWERTDDLRADRRARHWSSAPVTTRWIRRTWR